MSDLTLGISGGADRRRLHAVVGRRWRDLPFVWAHLISGQLIRIGHELNHSPSP